MEVTGVMVTDSGMGALWAPEPFRGIVDYETWEPELLADADIVRHITAGDFVPVNIGGDGAFQVLARVGEASAPAPAELTERERRYAEVTSAPYALITTGDAVISGIEHVGLAGGDRLRVPLPAGRWSVTIALIDWEAEPGQTDDAGWAVLPDFTILINPEGTAGRRYRTEVETFER